MSCSLCHVGQDLTDEDFHDLGVGFELEEPDLGLFDRTRAEADRGKFKTTSCVTEVEVPRLP